VQCGLPYKWSFETLKLPYGTQSGSAVNKQKGVPHVGLVLLDSGKFAFGTSSYDELEGRKAYDMQDIEFLRDGLTMDEPIPLFTGEVIRSLDGASRRDVRVYMEGISPLPFTCLAIVPQVTGSEK